MSFYEKYLDLEFITRKTMSFDDKMQIWFLIWKSMSFEKQYLDPVFNAKIYEFLMKKIQIWFLLCRKKKFVMKKYRYGFIM